MERWRKPAGILAVEEHPTSVEDEADGRTFGGVRMTVTTETMERLRLGRLCAKCLEPQEEAMPVRCRLCGFGIRSQQREWFEHYFRGIELVGSRLSLTDELERLKEEVL
jgi:hypothetical protein